MGIQDWSEDILLVDLVPEPQTEEDIRKLTEMVRDRGNCDAVIDFSDMEMIQAKNISNLLKLRKLMSDIDHRLVLCSVAGSVRGIFTVTGLDGIFEFADDKFVALASLQMVD
jgi:anti-anti-sigma factor